MTANDLFQLPAANTSRDPFRVRAHIPEVDFDRIRTDDAPKLEVRYYAQHCSDGERVWELYSVWLDEKPFLIGQEAGRGGEDYRNSWITDRERYGEAVAYLISLYEPLVPDPTDGNVLDPTKDVPDLDVFYGRSLWDYYSPDLEPLYLVGDVVRAWVPVNHLSHSKERVVTRVKIERVARFSPHETYWGTQLDRRWATDWLPGTQGVMVDDPENGTVGAVFSDEDVVGRA